MLNIRAGAWLFVLPILVISACGRQPATLNEQEKHKVNELTLNLKPRCIGRYVIDMPMDALVSGGAKVQGVIIEPKAMTHEEYLGEVAGRKVELSGTKSIDAYPFLYADDQVDGPDTHYFLYRGNVSDGPANRVFEVYKWDHGYRFKLGIVGIDFLHPDQTDAPSIKAMAVKNDVPQKTRLIFDIVKRLRWRAEDEIPAEQGLCFLGAFLPGKARAEEYAWAQYVLIGNRDVSIGFDSDSSIQEPNTLLQRGDQIDAGLKSIGGGTIRKGKVALPGIDAEEWLVSDKSDRGVPRSTLTLEANSMTSSVEAPLLTLDFQTGSPNAFTDSPVDAASMSEGEAVALWDVISRSLRPRPNGF
ncbi:T6SS immunity protein Tli4 family protein [Paraburkholderia sp. BR10882]|uniref:T6SS immunity protein Tli4 family protein n=1 Tax=unclassified Paraburkholderia TaxID=2615204 RepID=UPI0034CF81A7